MSKAFDALNEYRKANGCDLSEATFGGCQFCLFIPVCRKTLSQADVDAILADRIRGEETTILYRPQPDPSEPPIPCVRPGPPAPQPAHDGKYHTTEKHFRLFEAYVRYYVNIFGLVTWSLQFRHEEPDNNVLASCVFNTEARSAVFYFSHDWGDCNPDDHVRRIAFHETMELFLAESWNAAITKDLTDKQRETFMREVHHRAIRTLENVVLPLLPLPYSE